jgi:kumamolisin
MPASNHAPFPGSERSPVPGARRVGDADPNESLTVTLYLRRPAESRHDPAAFAATPPARRPRLDRGELASQQGALPDDMAQVTAFAQHYGLAVSSADPGQRRIMLSGTVGQMSAAFEVSLGRYERPGEVYRGREGPLHLPSELRDAVVGVFGLDDRRQVFPRLLPSAAAGAAQDSTAFYPPQVAKLYAFPVGRADGQRIALVEFGGGYTMPDLAGYFASLGVPIPQLAEVSVDGAANQPGTDADTEVLLDMEIAAAVAPGSSLVVYFAPASDRGFIDAISEALHDVTHRVNVISISWGAAESWWTDQARQVLDGLFADAATLGVTVLCAAGDHGAGDAAQDGRVHADFPASSPYVLACGGTSLKASGGSITSEVVWNSANGWATGGGVSAVFPVPDWQRSATIPPSCNKDEGLGRGVPDVAGDADVATGYLVRVHGQGVPVGGTSAVAPLYAGLAALLNAALGKPVGFLNPVLYRLSGTSTVFREITQGDNSVPASSYGPATPGYTAGPGWNACAGLGSLNGQELLAALRRAGW